MPTPPAHHLVAAVGAVALLLLVPVAVITDADYGSWRFTRIVAVAAFLLQARVLRRWTRAFELRGGDYGSLWLPGLAALVGLGLVEFLVLATAVLVLA